MEKVKITTEYIKLDQFLKYMGIAENGSHAKEIILAEDILVNGELEKRRGRKLYKNDVIELNNAKFIIE
ncbi:MAG: S4 domain-containing protein YaaA [Clostridia bacterium]|nr:S4 domain-containing protein YaaA [Clostridia bacterium]